MLVSYVSRVRAKLRTCKPQRLKRIRCVLRVVLVLLGELARALGGRRGGGGTQMITGACCSRVPRALLPAFAHHPMCDSHRM